MRRKRKVWFFNTRSSAATTLQKKTPRSVLQQTAFHTQQLSLLRLFHAFSLSPEKWSNELPFFLSPQQEICYVLTRTVPLPHHPQQLHHLPIHNFLPSDHWDLSVPPAHLQRQALDTKQTPLPLPFFTSEAVWSFCPKGIF